MTPDEIVEKLVLAFHLYGNYPVDSRGPSGLLMDIITALRPDVATVIRNESADVAWAQFFDDLKL